MKRIRSSGVDYPDDEDTKDVETNDKIEQGYFSDPERNHSRNKTVRSRMQSKTPIH
jgi:hypothetical protein